MNLQIINSCAGSEPRLSPVGTEPGLRYIFVLRIPFQPLFLPLLNNTFLGISQSVDVLVIFFLQFLQQCGWQWEWLEICVLRYSHLFNARRHECARQNCHCEVHHSLPREFSIIMSSHSMGNPIIFMLVLEFFYFINYFHFRMSYNELIINPCMSEYEMNLSSKSH